MEDKRDVGSILYAFNVVPSTAGLEVRGGSKLHATLADEVTAIMMLRAFGAETWFASDQAYLLYDITDPASATVTPSPSVYSQDYEWFGIEFTAAGGQYLLATTDGNDVVWVYDYTETTYKWQPLSATAPRVVPCDMSTLGDWETVEKDEWTPGTTITGGTSGATGELVGLTENGVWLENVAGSFDAGGETLSTPAPASRTITSTGADVAGPGTWTMTNLTNGYVDVSRPWVHRGRLWFAEPEALAAWYLDAGAFAGAATRFPLQGVFPRGGHLVAGGEVSSDSGSGMQSRCVFISSEGEVAIYEGDDPATWSLVGVYTIGKPTGPRGIVEVGGDISVITEIGLSSILTSIFAPQGTSEHTQVMERIRGYWEWLMGVYGPEDWTAVWWPFKGYFVLSPYTISSQLNSLVLNTRGQWSVFNGWQITAACVSGETMLFGNGDGKIAEAEEGGQDLGNSYTCWVAVLDQSETATKLQLRRGRVVMASYTDPGALMWAFEGTDLASNPPYGDAMGGVAETGTWGGPDPAWGHISWAASFVPAWDTFYEWQGLNARGHECIIGASALANTEARPRGAFQALEWYSELGEEPW